MKNRAGWLLIFTAMLLLGWMAGRWLRMDTRPGAAEARATPLREQEGVRVTEGARAREEGQSAGTPRRGKDALARALEEALVRLAAGQMTREQVAAFKAALLGADPRECIAAIREFLATKRDARTGHGLELAPGGGTLAEQPTLRLLLLDVLGQQARKLRSGEAAEVSREILEAKDSADEWALALRNVVWAQPQERAYVTGKVRELLSHEAWRSAPSAGLLEALDVAVWTGDAGLVPDLVAARSAGGELAHAVDIALDKLAERAPAEVMAYLNQNPGTLSERPLLRADYFAKADLAQGAQRAQVEIYLGRPDVGPEEKGKLLSALLTPSSFVGETLVTQPPAPDDGTARRAALSRTLAEWLRANQFPTLRAELEAVQRAAAE